MNTLSTTDVAFQPVSLPAPSPVSLDQRQQRSIQDLAKDIASNNSLWPRMSEYAQTDVVSKIARKMTKLFELEGFSIINDWSEMMEFGLAAE